MPQDNPLLIVVMGVSGTGKSTVGRAVAGQLGCTFVEGDDHHPAANVEKMRAGRPLTDHDRMQWLADLADILARARQAGAAVVLTCSALRRAYRDVLRGDGGADSVYFVHLAAQHDVLHARLRERQGHFMPASLLQSQLATLEPLGADEAGTTVDVAQPPDDVVVTVARAVREHLQR